jgi:hypothetical protein
MGGTNEDRVEAGVPISYERVRGGKDFVVNDHVGDRTDQSISDGGGLCVVLSEGAEPVEQ